MPHFGRYCRSVTVFCANAVKFTIDLPYFTYLFVHSILTCLWKKLTRKRKDVANEIVLITGAASGIGQQFTLSLAKLSSEVVLVLWDINQSGLEETAKECRNLGVTKVYTYMVDLSSHADVVRSASLVRHQVGSVTMLFNNAGISPYQYFLDSDTQTDEKVVRVNLLSQMWTIREFLPGMIEKGKGQIISTCSTAGFLRFRYLANYCASKHGLRGFLETLRLEMELHPEKPQIKFSVIYPGWVKTPMTSGVGAVWEPRYEIDLLMPMDVNRFVEKIVDGVLKEEDEIFAPSGVKNAIFLQGYLPTSFVNRLENFTMRNIRLAKDEVETV